MRRKVSTLLDETLFRRAKLESVRQGRQISEVIGEALEFYLREKGSRRSSTGVTAESWGALAMKKAKVKRIMAEEAGLLDS